MGSKTKILRLLSPNYAELLPAKVIAESDGRAYIIFTDSEGKHKVLLPDDVKPIQFKTGTILKNQESLYVMARDNFLSFDKAHFIVKGIITREMISDIAEWGAAKALIEATTRKALFEGGMGTILVVLGIGLVLWLVFTHMPAGVLPF